MNKIALSVLVCSLLAMSLEATHITSITNDSPSDAYLMILSQPNTKPAQSLYNVKGEVMVIAKNTPCLSGMCGLMYLAPCQTLVICTQKGYVAIPNDIRVCSLHRDNEGTVTY